MFILFITYFVAYWTFGLGYFLLDTVWPKLHWESYSKFKITPQSDTGFVIREYLRCIPLVLRNHFLVELPLLFILEKIYPDVSGMSVWMIIFNIVCQGILTNVSFSIVHYIYHKVKWLYPIHKTHHQFPIPIAICVEYLSLTENFIGYALHHSLYYFFPVPFDVLIWCLIGMNFVDLACHSNYDFMWMITRHNLHHTNFNINLTAFPWIEDRFGKDQ
jgi:sterol desaturase/sphingolipid hydroxylase (fatty acid hydroxylase superfamily)